jgi:hypothetical protein
MTAIAFYAALKFWLPMVTAFVLVIKAYRTLSSGVTTWADKLLNNHLSHIQTATEATATLLAQSHKDQQEYQKKDAETQQSIITSLEILKDRQ